MSAASSKQKISDVETEIEEARVELDAWNIYVAEMKALATELEEQLEHSALQMRVAKSK